MATVALNLDRLSDLEIVQLAGNVKTGLTGNANFTTPTPALAAGGTLITTATTKVAEASAGQAAAKMKTADKDAAVGAVRTLLKQWGSYAEITSGGDAVKIQSANLPIKSDAAPVGLPVQVANLSASSGDNDGELDIQWDPVRGARSYEIQVSPDPITANSWGAKPSATKSQATLSGLTSGQRVHVRVRAIGAGGTGAWSDDATKIVP